MWWTSKCCLLPFRQKLEMERMLAPISTPALAFFSGKLIVVGEYAGGAGGPMFALKGL